MAHLLLVDERYSANELVPRVANEPLRRSQTWEDDQVLRRALAVPRGDDVLTVCGGGCSVLSLLLDEPRSVVAVDPNPAQTALLELKLAALRRLSHPEFAAFLGARTADDREATYDRLSPALSDEARVFWDEHPLEIHEGILCSGTLDRHVRAFAEECVARLVDPDALRRFLSLSDVDEQAAMFARELTILEQPAKTWFGRSRVAGHARDGAQFRTAGKVAVGEQFWRRFTEVATRVPARSNPFLEWLLTGQYHRLPAGPPFLRPRNFARLRALADRVTIVRSSLQEFLPSRARRSFGAANLSDALDYLSDDEALELMALVASRMRPRARVAHWNLFGERCVFTTRSADRVRRLPQLGAQLLLDDRVPFYGGFEVGEALPARPFTVV